MFIVYTIVHIVCTAQTRESELWSSGAETGLEPWPSTFLTPLRHSAGIHALHNKSPALRECIPFLGFNRTPQNRSPRKMLTGNYFSTPAQMSPALTVPLIYPPFPASASSPPTSPPGLGRAAAAKCRRARSPAPTRPRAAPFEGGDAGQRPGLQGGGRMFLRGLRAPPRPEEPLGPAMRR